MLYRLVMSQSNNMKAIQTLVFVRTKSIETKTNMLRYVAAIDLQNSKEVNSFTSSSKTLNSSQKSWCSDQAKKIHKKWVNSDRAVNRRIRLDLGNSDLVVRQIFEPDGIEVHIVQLCETEITEDTPMVSSNTTLFILFTIESFGKHFSITEVFSRVKHEWRWILDDSGTSVVNPNPNGKALLTRLIEEFQTSQLQLVTEQVETIKPIMMENIAQALETVETLERMEEKAQKVEDGAKIFKIKATKLKAKMRCAHYKTTLILIAIVGSLLALIIWGVYKAVS